jgi:hypothetical protein
VSTAHSLELAWIEGEYAICRLPPHDRLGSIPGGRFVSMTRTSDELSVVCVREEVPDGARVEGAFALFRVRGSLELSMTGVLASIATPLAAAGVSIFSVATFDTDYVLVPERDRERAASALAAAGHRFVAE